jgi:hypothetical protein
MLMGVTSWELGVLRVPLIMVPDRTLLDMARIMLDEYKTPDWFGRKQSTLLATPSTGSTFIESSRRHHMNSSPVKSLMFHILESLVANDLFLLKEVKNPNLLLRL